MRGRPTTKLLHKGNTRTSGTSITFTPDPDIFGDIRFEHKRGREQLEIKSYLNRGLCIVFRDEGKAAEGGESGRPNDLFSTYEQVFVHEGGIVEYLTHLVQEEKVDAVHPNTFSLLQDKLVDGARIEVALQWTESPRERLRSYVNGDPHPRRGNPRAGVQGRGARRRAGLDGHPRRDPARGRGHAL